MCWLFQCQLIEAEQHRRQRGQEPGAGPKGFGCCSLGAHALSVLERHRQAASFRRSIIGCDTMCGLPVFALGLVPEATDQAGNNGEHHRYDNHGRDRRIEAHTWPLHADVTGKAAEPAKCPAYNQQAHADEEDAGDDNR